MLEGSFVKCAQDFFSTPPYGRKIMIDEFKALTREDKVELRQGLIDQGYVVAEIAEAKSE